MNNIQFIEKAIEGGWHPSFSPNRIYWSPSRIKSRPGQVALMLLDPLFWQALGKTEGWEKPATYWTRQGYQGDAVTLLDAWECNWHSMIDALAEGKSIEQFLETL